MRKGEQTRHEIIRKAAPIFNQKGYEGAALSDLMEATGLEKGVNKSCEISPKIEQAVFSMDTSAQQLFCCCASNV